MCPHPLLLIAISDDSRSRLDLVADGKRVFIYVLVKIFIQKTIKFLVITVRKKSQFILVLVSNVSRRLNYSVLP